MLDYWCRLDILLNTLRFAYRRVAQTNANKWSGGRSTRMYWTTAEARKRGCAARPHLKLLPSSNPTSHYTSYFPYRSSCNLVRVSSTCNRCIEACRSGPQQQWRSPATRQPGSKHSKRGCAGGVGRGTRAWEWRAVACGLRTSHPFLPNFPSLLTHPFPLLPLFPLNYHAQH